MTVTETSTQVRCTSTALPFGMVLVALLLAAANYGNNLIYFFFYLIAVMAGFSYVLARRNATGLVVLAGESSAVFAGESLRLTLQVRNGTRDPKIGLYASTPEPVLPAPSASIGPTGPWEINALDQCAITLEIPTHQRGRYQITEVEIGSTFPLGFFRVSSIHRVMVSFLVYPAPHGTAPWPETTIADGAGTVAVGPGGEDFSGHRIYREGESLRRVDWRAFARGRPMLIKDFAGSGGATVLDRNDLPDLSTETALQQIAQWILEAEAKNQPYALRLQGRVLGPGLGRAHRDLCLAALAEVEA